MREFWLGFSVAFPAPSRKTASGNPRDGEGVSFAVKDGRLSTTPSSLPPRLPCVAAMDSARPSSRLWLGSFENEDQPRDSNSCPNRPWRLPQISVERDATRRFVFCSRDDHLQDFIPSNASSSKRWKKIYLPIRRRERGIWCARLES